MKFSTRKIVVSGMLGGITIILGVTPLGLIPIGVVTITTLHIPVLIGALLEGPVVGTIIGAFFGFTSLIRMMTGNSSAVQMALLFHPVILLLPRLLIAPVSYGAYLLVKNLLSRTKLHRAVQDTASWAVCAVVGTLVNTVGVLSLSDVFRGEYAAETLNMSREAVRAMLYGVAATNGIPECIAAAIISIAVMGAMSRVRKAPAAH